MPTIMQGFPPPPDQRPTLTNWDWPPMNRWSFSHVREVLPTVAVHRGAGPRSMLHEAHLALGDVMFEGHDGDTLDVSGWLGNSFTDGFIVLHHGKIVFERYNNVMTPRTLHLSQSVAKSVTGAVAGILIGRGVMNPDAPLTTWIPEFAGCGYEGATLRHAMDMCSGVRFSEDYTDPDCDCALLERIGGWKPAVEGDPSSLFEFAQTLDRVRPHGVAMDYRSIETDVMAMCMERATGVRLADLVSEHLWGPLGVDEDAAYTVDRAGYAMASGGFNATLRDYARFGEMLTQDGTFNGQQIVPAAFIAESRKGDARKFPEKNWVTLPNGAYRNTFWNEDVSTRVLMCLGIFGQFIYSDPDQAFTAVKLSSWPEPTSDRRKVETIRAIHAIKAAV